KDNDSEWKIFSYCNNKVTSTPGVTNGTIYCSVDDLDDYMTLDNQLFAYPNPTSDILIVTALQPMLSLNVYDLTGRLIKNLEPNDVRCELDLSSCNVGIYYLYAQTNDGVARLKVQKK
ncbi:MAG: T9SS type A sorting domain-containing protein, partial [Paludibacteraceae bacterium]|nr:T9SS type A sorting domain-containing protein [Paludibacteraceae bacterium]